MSEQLPERMRANRALEGRICSGCGQAIELGDDVFNCQACQGTMHIQCHDMKGGCANTACQNFAQPQAAMAATATAPGGSAASGAEESAPCVACGEAIRKGALKCRYCGEYQKPADRAREARRKKEAESDENLTAVEIIFAILCGGIACILGLIWVIQGKKKGGKMVGIALLSILIWNLIRAAADG